MRILVVEDDREAGILLRDALVAAGWSAELRLDGTEASASLAAGGFDAVVADVDLPGKSGIELARETLRGDGAKEPGFILVSGQDRIIESVNALELGVDDFLPKPLNLKRLVALLKRIEERRNSVPIAPTEELRQKVGAAKTLQLSELPEPRSLLSPNEAPFIGVYGPKMFAVCERLRKVAPYRDIPVLIEGETGTGKELIARFVSIIDQEFEGPFVGLNCSLFNSEFFAAELFGYEHGAFTGAAQRGKTGMLDLAAGGCLFLDEVTEMSLELQARFLRVLQERNFYRLGGSKLIDVSSRFVFATNRDIAALVEEGRFRQDLYYRLSPCIIRVPPLRERREEILPLSLRFLKAMNAGSRIAARRVETAAFELLEDHDWPGNARELQNAISSWVLFETGETLKAESLAALLRDGRPRSAPQATEDEPAPTRGAFAAPGFDLRDIRIPDEPMDLAELEREIVRKTLAKFGGNKARTAQFLGISRSQLYDKYREDSGLAEQKKED